MQNRQIGVAMTQPKIQSNRNGAPPTLGSMRFAKGIASERATAGNAVSTITANRLARFTGSR